MCSMNGYKRSMGRHVRNLAEASVSLCGLRSATDKYFAFASLLIIGCFITPSLICNDDYHNANGRWSVYVMVYTLCQTRNLMVVGLSPVQDS